MSDTAIEYEQIKFLYAFLRQIDLSLDRSKLENWNILQDYFESRIKPNEVMYYLNNHFSIVESDLYNVKRSRVRIWDKVQLFLFKKYFLKKEEVLVAYKLISDFKKILDLENIVYDKYVEKLRIDISNFYTNILEPRIRKKDLDKLKRVEHLNQNNIIRTIKLNEFIPSEFNRICK